MSDQTPQIDKWILSPPGGPAGPFWGIVTQSGKVIALQIDNRVNARILQIMGNVLAGDFDTNRAVVDRLGTFTYDPSSYDYMVRALAEAVLGLAKESDE